MATSGKNASAKAIGPSTTHELAGLEILRFLCAFAVLVWHYQHFFFTGPYDDSRGQALRAAEPLHWLLRPMYEHGSRAVQIFWAISGFIFYWKYARQIFDRRIRFDDFSFRRISRLYPLHLVTLILVGWLQYLYFKSHGDYFIYENNTTHAFVGQLLLWYGGPTSGFNEPIWSILVEVIIYVAFFWVVRLISGAPVVAALVSGVGLVLYLGGVSSFIFDGYVFECTFLFFAGGLVYWLTKWLSKLPSRVNLGVCTGVPVVSILALYVFHISFREADLRFASTAVASLGSVLVFASLEKTSFGSVARSFAFLGNATYSLYLMHFPIQLGIVLLVDFMGYERAVFFSPVALAAYLGLVVGVSLPIYYLFELPAQKWMRRHYVRFAGPALPESG
jgi:peptidoglycan/LPS O-acetylase OafA/YrhL